MMQKHKIVIFDLDDTLYKEIDFLKSAFREIADYLRDQYGIIGLFPEMLQYYEEKKDVFQELINLYRIPIEKQFLIDMYRNHFPQIQLDEDTTFVLDRLKSNPVILLGLITDGRLISQMNTIKALGLDQYINEESIIISGVWQRQKPDEFLYSLIEEQYPNCCYMYVGDNIEKDFLAPNQKGWETVCLLDNGRNIHKQDFNIDTPYLPKKRIANIRDLLGII